MFLQSAWHMSIMIFPEAAMRPISLVIAVLVICRSALGQEDRKPLTPAEAAKKIDQQVTLEMAVKSSGGGRNRYLNSMPDYSAASNFTIFIPQAAMGKFAQAKIENPDEHFYGKTIQVTGTVTLARDKPQIAVTEPGQIKIVDSKSGPPVLKKTHPYKRVGKLSIKADSYRFDERSVRPVVVWIHGGALINGHRERGPSWRGGAAAGHGHAPPLD